MVVNITLRYYLGRDYYNFTFSVWLMAVCHMILCLIFIKTQTGRIFAIIFVRMYFGPFNIKEHHDDTGEWIIAAGCVIFPLTFITTFAIFPITWRIHNTIANLWSALGVLVAFNYIMAVGIGDLWAWACLFWLISICRDRMTPTNNISITFSNSMPCPIPCHGHLTESQIDRFLSGHGEYTESKVKSFFKILRCQRRDMQLRRPENSAYNDNVKLFIIHS